MSDVVDQIAAVIRKHDIDVYLNDDDTSGSMCLGCDWIRQDATGTECAAHVAEQVAALPVVLIDTDDDADPFYAYQEEMTHKAAADRITYGQWIRRELEGRIAEEERKAYLDGFNDGRYGD